MSTASGCAPHGRLTPAQIRVIAGFARGHSTHRIAADLDITEHAIRGHIERAATRTQTRGRPIPGLIAHAYRHGDFDHIPELAVKTTPTPPAMRLPPAELRTLACMAAGLSTNEAARDLGISKETVRSYRRRLYVRLGTTSAPRAVALGWQWGLLGRRRPGTVSA